MPDSQPQHHGRGDRNQESVHKFRCASGCGDGLSQLFVVANGIPSSPYSIKVR